MHGAQRMCMCMCRGCAGRVRCGGGGALVTCSVSASWKTSALLEPFIIESVDTPPLFTSTSRPVRQARSPCAQTRPALLAAKAL